MFKTNLLKIAEFYIYNHIKLSKKTIFSGTLIPEILNFLTSKSKAKLRS